jgi:para-aminobenzoate synthetase
MKPKILFIDAYDSFANNIVSLLETGFNVEVTKIKIDDEIPDFAAYVRSFVAVVAGPGPGHPANELDTGLIRHLWTLPEDHIRPVLGICLGFQSLVFAHGGTVVPLDRPRHGIITCITTSGKGIFQDIDQVRSVQYHSLHGYLGHYAHEPPSTSEECQNLWEPHSSTPMLTPLAWEFSRSNPESDAGGKENPHCILMAVSHVSKPFYGVQFHPESVCSPSNAADVVGNWWKLVQVWHNDRRRRTTSRVDTERITTASAFETEDSQLCWPIPEIRCSASSPNLTTPSQSACSSVSSASTVSSGSSLPSSSMFRRSMSYTNWTIPKVIQELGDIGEEIIILDSERRQVPEIGEYSIIGLIGPDTTTIKYVVDDQHVRVENAKGTFVENLHGRTIFIYLKEFMESHRLNHSETSDLPFSGGLMGYISYEACLETLQILNHHSRRDRPDICFAFVERSIVLHHTQQQLHVQSIKLDDCPWVLDTFEKLKISPTGSPQDSSCLANNLKHWSEYSIQIPSENAYMGKIRDCQSNIRAGNSYELCLTDQTVVKARSTTPKIAWSLYCRLRRINPAPFSAYVRLGPLTLLSTSPERFMSWTRPSIDPLTDNSALTTCQFRPIKGTVKKQETGENGYKRTVSTEEATTLLSSPKERAENLMIVDLIRHDLYGVVGSGNVSVKALMVVEEYETVYQLVSVIEGKLETPGYWSKRADTLPIFTPYDSPHESKEGIDVLAASLPPGSMTGAPKRRACQLLQSIEGNQPRSVYSGVLGYMSVCGGGDFSVVIRSAFRWDQEDGSGEDIWRVGAGGAITDLSSETGEWEEMMTKLNSTLGLFTVFGD